MINTWYVSVEKKNWERGLQISFGILSGFPSLLTLGHVSLIPLPFLSIHPGLSLPCGPGHSPACRVPPEYLPRPLWRARLTGAGGDSAGMSAGRHLTATGTYGGRLCCLVAPTPGRSHAEGPVTSQSSWRHAEHVIGSWMTQVTTCHRERGVFM